MWHDMQGHVAEPCEPTRAPVWRGGDTCMRIIFIYILYMVIVSISVPMIGTR